VDGFDSAEVPAKTLQALADLRAVIPSIPLIFTCRIHTEGGMRTIDQPTRLALICDAIKTGYLDIVDIELCNSLDFIQTIIDTAGRHNVKVILSFHDFEKTPEEGVIFERLQRAQQMGGHIAKVAIMPNTIADVLVLLKATLKARTQGLQIPIVTIAMGAQGVITRLAGGLFGSDITFAIGKNASAPGQIPIQELRQAMALLY
jgi:3-dehydroquinate dehydratase-1